MSKIVFHCPVDRSCKLSKDCGITFCKEHDVLAIGVTVQLRQTKPRRETCTHIGVKFLTVRLSCTGLVTKVCPRCGLEAV